MRMRNGPYSSLLALQVLKGNPEQRRQLLKQKKMSMLNEYVERKNGMIPLPSQTTPSLGPGKLKEFLMT